MLARVSLLDTMKPPPRHSTNDLRVVAKPSSLSEKQKEKLLVRVFDLLLGEDQRDRDRGSGPNTDMV